MMKTFEIGQKVRYEGKKYKVSFIHEFESLLTNYRMYDITRKGKTLCVLDVRLSEVK